MPGLRGADRDPALRQPEVPVVPGVHGGEAQAVRGSVAGDVAIWLLCNPLLALAIDVTFVLAVLAVRRRIPPIEEML